MEAREQFERERASYWAMREELLPRYKGKWVAVVGGKVVAVAENKSEVLMEAIRKGGKVGFVTCVGYEEVVSKKVVRKVALGYFNRSYIPPIPVVEAEVIAPFPAKQASVEFIVDTEFELLVWAKENLVRFKGGT